MKYQIIRNDGLYEQKYKANQFVEFFGKLQTITSVYEKDFTFLIDNKIVSLDDAINHCNIMFDNKLNDKLQTHKLIWVRNGVTNAKNNWHQKWIKK